MEFKVPDRVHLVPVGYEEERAYESVEKLKAERVILIRHTNNDEQGETHFERVKTKLEEMGYEPEPYKCDFFDLYDSLAKFNYLIAENRSEEIFVNVATGSKITAIAGMISANINDVTAYYAKAREYDDKEIPKGIEEIFELPRYPIESPDPELVKVLKFLHQNRSEAISKKDLIDFAEESDISYFIDKKSSRKAQYRVLDNKIIEPLLNDDYIELEKEGRSQVVNITESGSQLLRAFGHDLPDNQYVETAQNIGEAS